MSNSLLVMTYNICDGGQERFELIQQVIASAEPHVILLNEADDEPTVVKLAQKLSMTHIWARGSGNKHIALLSRLPIARWQIYNRRPITQALLEAELEPRSGESLKIYGVHLLPYFMLFPYEVARWRSVSAILNRVKKRANGPHLIIGDFNAVAPGDSADLAIFPHKVQRLMRLQANRMAHLALRPLKRAGYVDTYRALHPNERGWTWMPTSPSARLDYIFADAHMAARLRACDVVETPAAARSSDHFPLLAQFVS